MKQIWKIAFILLLIYLIVKLVLKKNTMDTNNDYLNLPFINKVKDNVSQFGNKVISIANDLLWNAKWLMAIMNNETVGTFSPSIKNPLGTATGLIQFTEATAKDLGTSTAQLKKMSNVEQLDYVKKYLMRYKSKVKSMADAYLAVFYPLALYKDDNFTFPAWAVKGNKTFDINKDGVLTKKEFVKAVNDKYSQYV